jgi:hypothetical protein
VGTDGRAAAAGAGAGADASTLRDAAGAAAGAALRGRTLIVRRTVSVRTSTGVALGAAVEDDSPAPALSATAASTPSAASVAPVAMLVRLKVMAGTVATRRPTAEQARDKTWQSLAGRVLRRG